MAKKLKIKNQNIKTEHLLSKDELNALNQFTDVTGDQPLNPLIQLFTGARSAKDLFLSSAITKKKMYN